MNSSAKSYGCK